MKIPSLKQILDLRHVIARAIRRLRDDKPAIAARDIREWRESVCRRCPNCINKTSRHAQCTVCVCFVVLKVSLDAERCPDNPPRW